MEARLAALKLVLDELGESSDISSVSERLRLQKAVYLTQALGLNLGYHYSWYLRGPYSTSLTQDYYQLADLLAAGDQPGAVLNSGAKQALQNVRGLLTKPAEVGLAAHHWYELLASLHYLITVSKKTEADANAALQISKPHLVAWSAQGIEHLRRFGLV